jgi:hypothetical protein
METIKCRRHDSVSNLSVRFEKAMMAVTNTVLGLHDAEDIVAQGCYSDKKKLSKVFEYIDQQNGSEAKYSLLKDDKAMTDWGMLTWEEKSDRGTVLFFVDENKVPISEKILLSMD